MRRFQTPPPGGALGPGPPPTFSVIVAAYQAADTIAEAVGSALEQTRPALEVLVCDDGSTDGTARVLERFGDSVEVLRQPNRGAPSARNRLIERARGDFVVLLDADDVFHPERLEALAELAVARPDLDLLATDSWMEREGRRVARFNELNPFPVERQAAEMTRRCYIVTPAVRLRPLLDAGGFDEALAAGSDWDCWLRLLLGGAAAGLVDEPLMTYRLRPDSITDDLAVSLAARVVLLDRVRDHPALTPTERAELAQRLEVHRTRALVAEAHSSTARGEKAARRRLLRVARERRAGLGVRLQALAMAASPRLARLLAGSRLGRRARLGG
jgi:cellulose synthase/poly-beta-1,6-N-acetylglucosamine synthase-like glycosyltransferase